MKKICAIAVPLLLATGTDAHCPRGYEVAMHSGSLSCIKAVSSSDSAVEDGKKKKSKSKGSKKSSKSKGSKKSEDGKKKKSKSKGSKKSKKKKKSKSKSKGGLESTDTWLKTRSMNTDAVDDGIRIYASKRTAVDSPSNAYTVEVPDALRSEERLSAMGSIVITRCNKGDYDPKKGKDKYLGSCANVCGKDCYEEDELQPIVQTRAVIGNCVCDWSEESECEKEEHHCTVVAPACDCSASDIGGSYEAHLQLAIHSGGKRVKNNYVMQIKPSKDHGFLSVFSPSGHSYDGESTSLLGPFQGEHDDDKKFVPTWNNVFSMGIPGGNSGKPITVRGKYTLTLGPWDAYHKKVEDTCSPLILTRVLFNKNKMSPQTRQSDSSREGIFSTKVSQNCLHPDWDKPGETRVCTYEFADTGLLDTNDKGYVSVAVNMHKSCILEPNQKLDNGGKATGDYYRITDVDISATVLD